MLTREESAKTQLGLYLDAAYNLARWLTRDEDKAEDVVREAYRRAYECLPAVAEGKPRAWLMTIVRNCSYDLLSRTGTRSRDDAFDERVPAIGNMSAYYPESALLREELVRNAFTELHPEHREILVLREMERFSYREIATTMGVPLDSVVSRLNRARTRFQQNLADQVDAERVV
jgi:RNA polymerase sigma-70 factor (ECF subfamily)